jgi:mono/diheme cytochrome c family protein
VAAALTAVLLLGGCSAGSSGATGADNYRSTCASCHASDGGGGLGKNLHGVEDRYTLDEHIAIVTNGRGQMPKFGGDLSREEIDSVVRFERTELGK